MKITVVSENVKDTQVYSHHHTTTHTTLED